MEPFDQQALAEVRHDLALERAGELACLEQLRRQDLAMLEPSTTQAGAHRPPW